MRNQLWQRLHTLKHKVSTISLHTKMDLNAKYFEYDSDGAKVVILNKGLLLPDHFNYREYKVEFLKERLEGYRFKNLILYRSLTVFLKERNDGISAHTFNITLLSRKKIRYIRQSLSKMIKLNKRQNIVDGRT